MGASNGQMRGRMKKKQLADGFFLSQDNENSWSRNGFKKRERERERGKADRDPRVRVISLPRFILARRR